VFDANGTPLIEQPIIPSDDASTMSDLSLTANERRATSLMADVEPKVAAGIRRGDLPKDTVLVLNNPPCIGPMSCDSYLPDILPQGSRLAVYVSEGPTTYLYRIFHGTGSKVR
jgi:hypothetical protein